MPITAEGAAKLLARYDKRTVDKGLVYANEGRVEQRERTDAVVRATVHGGAPYDVLLEATKGGFFSHCDCPAFARESRCKHVAALAWSMQPDIAARTKAPATAAKPLLALPDSLRHLFSAEALFERLALYIGEPIASDPSARWTPVAPWWRTNDAQRPRIRELRELVVAQAPAIDETILALQRWRPRRGLFRTSDLGRFHDQLADVYEDVRRTCIVRKAVPGPLDERHSGFHFEFDAVARTLRVAENPAPLLRAPLYYDVHVPLDLARPVRFDAGVFDRSANHDAWDLFALRALILALEGQTDPVIKKLSAELSQPLWEQMLGRLGTPATTEKEWAFTMIPSVAGSFALEVSSRAKKAKAGTWKRTTFEAIFKEGAPAYEQGIARTVLATREAGRTATFRFGSTAAHEVLRQLQHHPRLWVAERANAKTEPQVVTDVIVGELSVRLVREKRGVLAPLFFVGEKEVAVPSGERIFDGNRAPFLDGAIVRERGEITVLSIEVPPPLQRWVETAARLGDAFRFPAEAIPKLAERTAPLVAAGHVELPREALGDEVTGTPRPALRIEWQMDREEPTATVEVLLELHPDAPLTPRGGPRLFTFEQNGKRVFLERDKVREDEIVEALLERGIADIDFAWLSPTTWLTRDLEQTLALAAWLEANPEGLRIEVKVGRPPAVHTMKHGLDDATLAVSRVDKWLVFDGALTLGDTKLTLGAILEAIRQAKRFVKAGDGMFLELTNDIREKLRPIAVATELVPRSEQTEDGLRIREAFGVTLADVAKLFGTVETKVDLASYVTRFEGREKKPKVPKLEKGELRPYQHDGVGWMLGLATWAPGCILADDMGLGKTIQTAAVLKARAKLGPALIVAPASVSSNWVRELERFMPSLRVSWFNAERRDVSALAAGDVLVVSYNLLQRRKDEFFEQTWATVVLDEAQYVKNIEADRSKSVRKLPRDFTIALTGTPVENDLGELHAIVDLVFPGLLGDERVFRESFRKPIELRGDKDRLAILGRLIGPFLLRRTRAAVLDELPAREEVTELLELSEEERKRYLALRKVVEEDIGERKKSGVQGMRIELLAALTRLRQLACEVRLLDEDFRGPSTKTDRVVELVGQLAAEGNHALVFSQFTSFLTRVRDALARAGLRVAYLSGETPTTVRQGLIDDFQAGKYDVFCVSLLAGGTGLNLTRASYVVHLDPWWNPAAEEQATARAHRMGQTNPVTVYRLVSRGTIEEAVLKLHAKKRELAAAVLEGRGEASTVSSEELLELLGVQ